MERISTILKQFISERIPRKITNVFFQMFSGIEAMFQNLEYRLDSTKRERNILTAQHLSSLRTLASNNGFEPSLKIPSKGLLQLKISPKLFNRVGYPIFIPPYAIFTDKVSKLTYYYNSNRVYKISNTNILTIPCVEGELKSVVAIGTSDTINRIYLPEENIAEGSIIITVNNIEYQEVKSFFDNENLNNNRLFITKFSNDIQAPIVLYVKGVKYQDSINITYRLTNGELGNIVGKHEFDTEAIIDNMGNFIEIDDNEIEIINFTGFDLGSNGSDENSLRAAIGYNHGKTLLFDNSSYKQFISKYSTILIQTIKNPENAKSINNIYLSRKQSINLTTNNSNDYINQYKSIINTKAYLLTKAEKLALSSVLAQYEYGLTSHNIYDSVYCKFGFQISMKNQNDIDLYFNDLKEIIYMNFVKFLYIKDHIFNIENTFEQFMIDNKITFEYVLFNQFVEREKLTNKVDLATKYIISHDEYLPILKGDFAICDSDFNSFTLFSDINCIIL